MESARAFANKIWNAARFLFMKMEASGVEPWIPGPDAPLKPETPNGSSVATLEDRWIYSRLNRCADLMNRAIENFRYHEAAQLVWGFFWHEFCDWYVEMKKLRFRDGSGMTAEWRNMLTVFEAALRLLHPVMPFLSEELWQRLAANAIERPQSIAQSCFPQYAPERADLEAEHHMELLQQIITAARNLRADLKLDPKQLLAGALYSPGRALEVAREQQEAIVKLAGVKLALHGGHAPKAGAGMRGTPEFDLVLEVPAGQPDVQRKRLAKEIQQLEKNITNSERQLGDEAFLAKAPEKVVVSIREKLSEYKAQLNKSQDALDNLGHG